MIIQLRKFLFLTTLFANLSFASNVFISNYIFAWGEKNPDVVEKYLRKSLDNPEVAYILGTLHLTGTILQKDIQKADWFITKAANMNYPPAINSLGDGYYSGDIRPKDITKALKFYEKAAKMGFGPAQFNAGVVFLKNAKNKNDLKLAILYLKKASQNQKDLGEMTSAAKRYLKEAKHKLGS